MVNNADLVVTIDPPVSTPHMSSFREGSARLGTQSLNNATPLVDVMSGNSSAEPTIVSLQKKSADVRLALNDLMAHHAISPAEYREAMKNFDAIQRAASKDGQPVLLTQDRDSKDPHSLIDHLETVAKTGKGSTLVGMLDNIAHSDSSVFQDRRETSDTCTESAVQSRLICTAPAEYARMIAELSSKGECRFFGSDGVVSGKMPAADISGFNSKNDSRSTDELLFQESFKAHVSYLGVEPSGGGKFSGAYEMIVEATTGKDYTRKDPGNISLSDISHATDAGDAVFASVRFKLKDGEEVKHAVEIKGVQDGYVIYRDPYEWKAHEAGVTFSEAVPVDMEKGYFKIRAENFIREAAFVLVPDKNGVGITAGSEEEQVLQGGSPTPTQLFVPESVIMETILRSLETKKVESKKDSVKVPVFERHESENLV